MCDDTLIPEPWKRFFDNHIPDLRMVATTKLSVDKAQELETTVSEFLLDLTATNGIIGLPVTETPKIPVLETRATLMILLMSFVGPAAFTLTHSENV
jgi:hypothetical protein